MSSLRPVPRILWEEIVADDLRTDLGRGGDVTTDAVIPRDALATASVIARAGGRIAGLEMAGATFGLLDPGTRVDYLAMDGEDAEAGAVLATVSGPARAILSAERTALNLLGHLSGIATATRDVVQLVEGTAVAVAETRKTTPGLRALEKYAVRAGGGRNHRFGLDDAVMIKDNHIAVAGGVSEAIVAVQGSVGHMVTIEVEVDTLEQLERVMRHEVDVVLLDNMSIEELMAAVAIVDGRALVEASGGITPETVRAVAETGVDVVSMGWLTHSAPNLDVALDIERVDYQVAT